MSGSGKKRYQVTLTQETVERFKALSEEMNMPQGTMSSILDESLSKAVKVFGQLKAKGKVGFADMFHLIGETFDEIQEDEQKGKTKKAKK